LDELEELTDKMDELLELIEDIKVEFEIRELDKLELCKVFREEITVEIEEFSSISCWVPLGVGIPGGLGLPGSKLSAKTLIEVPKKFATKPKTKNNKVKDFAKPKAVTKIGFNFPRFLPRYLVFFIKFGF